MLSLSRSAIKLYLYRESPRTLAALVVAVVVVAVVIVAVVIVAVVIVAVAFCCVDTVAVFCCVVVLNARAASLRLRAVVEFCVVSLGDECRVAIIFHALSTIYRL